MPIAMRRPEPGRESLRSSDEEPKTRQYGQPKAKRVSRGEPQGAVRRKSTTGMHFIPPKLLKTPSVSLSVNVAWRSSADNHRGAVYRATVDGNRVFVKGGSSVPDLWDTVFLFVRINTVVGPANLHLRGTVICLIEEEPEKPPNGFAVRLFQAGKAADLEAWRAHVKQAAADRADERRRKA